MKEPLFGGKRPEGPTFGKREISPPGPQLKPESVQKQEPESKEGREEGLQREQERVLKFLGGLDDPKIQSLFVSLKEGMAKVENPNPDAVDRETLEDTCNQINEQLERLKRPRIDWSQVISST